MRGWKAYLVAYLAKFILRLLFFSCRVQIQGLDQFTHTAARGRCILMLWHNRLGLTPEILYRYAPQFVYVAFVSKSRDGELLAILANSYAAGRSLRVAAEGRHSALKQSIDRLKAGKEVLVFTPDGPRGPKYRVKPGIALAAREAQAHVVPLTWKASRFWQLKSWDGFMLPKPFAKLEIVFEEPIAVSQNHDLEALSDLFEKSLLLRELGGQSAQL